MTEGFAFFAQLDHPGDNLRCGTVGKKSVVELAVECTATAGCAAFSVSQGEADPGPVYCLKDRSAISLDHETKSMEGPCQGMYFRTAGKSSTSTVQHVRRVPAIPHTSHLKHPKPSQTAHMVTMMRQG